jgi:hypothetical protein
MGLSRFDVLHLHDPDDHLPQASTTAYHALRDLRAEGTVTAIGAGANQPEPLAELIRGCDLDVVLVAGRYTLLDQTALADLLPLCESRGVSVVIGGVFNSGVLIDPAPGVNFNYLPADRAILAKATAIKEICDKYDVPWRRPRSSSRWPTRGCAPCWWVPGQSANWKPTCPCSTWRSRPSSGRICGTRGCSAPTSRHRGTEAPGDAYRRASSPNVAVKLSGMVTEADWVTWSSGGLRPFVSQVAGRTRARRLRWGKRTRRPTPVLSGWRHRASWEPGSVRR